MPPDGKAGGERFADLVSEDVVPLGEKPPKARTPVNRPEPPYTTHPARGQDGTPSRVLPPYSDHDRDLASRGMLAVPDDFGAHGMPPKELDALRKAEPADELDLHGLTAQEAHAEIDRFLRDAIGRGTRVVEICHGRGLQSAERPVLKILTRHWLKGSKAVLGYATPKRNQGVVRVRLRKAERLP